MVLKSYVTAAPTVTNIANTRTGAVSQSLAVALSASRRRARFEERVVKLPQGSVLTGLTIAEDEGQRDETKRRRTLYQLNKGEDRHKLARSVFHGKRGELRQRYREGQEDQLDALGLVVNIIVLWNTIYIDAALTQLARKAILSETKTSPGSLR